MRGSGYEFEYPVVTTDRRTGRDTTNFIDLYRREHFILEAKHVEVGADRVLGAAYGQAKGYAGDVPHGSPPYLMVMNVARTLLLWDRWGGNYGGVNAAHRIDLRTFWQRDDEIEWLCTVWEAPATLNPSVRGRAVTREVAERLAKLAASLESRGVDGERVARFLMRCMFTMFAEDVGLLPGRPLQSALQTFVSGGGGGILLIDNDLENTERVRAFERGLASLWQAMDTGDVFAWQKLLKFNGHFFAEAEVLELAPADLRILFEAAEADWRYVEPTIFGTLLTRALDPAERHRLGAEYTPREYVERVVRQTIDVPLREQWGPVHAHIADLLQSGRRRDINSALTELRGFHEKLRRLRFLDPACGSGNFLYVALHMVKRLELEVLRAIEEITGHPELGIEEVGPWQFYGIEVKPWAREIAELTLWIGYHQFWIEHHKGVNSPEPVLKDTGTLELRDAVLAWDEIVEVPEKSRPDPTPRIVHPVTGKLVPDPEARLSYFEYRGARQAEWPQADFIVGNPPYLGTKRMREAFGDGYVEALRGAYLELPDSADYVMYWWHRAAEAVAARVTTRSGLITTNSITMSQNRRVIEAAAVAGARVIWAVPDHPWVDEAGSAAVRVAMTVVSAGRRAGALVRVDENAMITRETTVAEINADLTAHADVASAARIPLAANSGLSSFGFMINGAGFILRKEEAGQLLALDPRNREIIRPYLNGRDLASRPRGAWIIDFGSRPESDAREYTGLYDIVRDRVMHHRFAKSDPSSRLRWWQFARTREEFRTACRNLSRFAATVETSKHRYFTFLDTSVAPDHKLIGIAVSDAWVLGALSSAAHVAWATSAGGRLGVGNDPVYNKTLCFDPFPFPDPPAHLRERIGRVTEALDQHRKDAIARDERVTMTGMYNVVEKLRGNEPLTTKERAVHELAACGVLKDLHDELDRLVAEAYGWPWPMEREEILERLVALHDERVEEEKQGIVRWLRPEYQMARFGDGVAPEPALDLPEPPSEPAAAQANPWPTVVVEQIGAAKAHLALAPATPGEVAEAFVGAPVALVTRHLETLEMVGEVRRLPDGRYEAVTEPL